MYTHTPAYAHIIDVPYIEYSIHPYLPRRTNAEALTEEEPCCTGVQTAELTIFSHFRRQILIVPLQEVVA